MVSKDDKLIILDDIVVNKNYSKFKRLKNSGISVSETSYNLPTNIPLTEHISNSDEEVVPNNQDTDISYIKLKEDAVKNPESPEALAYSIISSIDRSYLNDGLISFNKAIKSRIQKYWDGLEVDVESISHKESKLSRIVNIAQRSLKKLFKSNELSIIEMMDQMKDNLEILNAKDYAIDSYVNFMNKVKLLNNNPGTIQAAQRIITLECEKILISNQKFIKYISESQIVKFIKNTEEGLAIDYLSDYSRNIPLEVMDKFEEAEKQEVFDNYIVFHYIDKNDKKSINRHYKNLDKKRDPILFGLIKGSRKLYYVCDWIDEYCDLTLSQFIDKIGESEHNLLED